MLISRRPETSRGSIPNRTAVGLDAEQIEERVLRALKDLRSASRGMAFDALYSAFLECGAHGWDGQDAVPVTADTFALARDFLTGLPAAFPSPEVAALEDGTVSLDWFPDAESMVSVALYPDRRVVFASVTGGRRIRGAEVMDEHVPDAILAELRRLF